MEKKEIVIDSSLQSNLNSLIENTLQENQKMEEDLNFFLSNKYCQPKKICGEKDKAVQHNQDKILKLFIQLFYNGVKEEDLFDRNLVFDVYTLITKNINPFSLERKIYDVKNREILGRM